MKTREDIERLKRDWRNDPCWDIADTPGFEDHRDELAEYQCQREAERDQKRESAIVVEMLRMGISDRATYDYLKGLERRLERLETRLYGDEF